MKEIIIDGINLSELKLEYDALAAKQSSMRSSIAKGSSKFIADAIKQAVEHVEVMKETEDIEVAEAQAKLAADLLTAAQFVSSVSGVAYEVPYYDYDTDNGEGEPITRIIEDGDYPLLSDTDSAAINSLYSIAEEMEGETVEWNRSYC